jgi:hypothetical protein
MGKLCRMIINSILMKTISSNAIAEPPPVVVCVYVYIYIDIRKYIYIII